MKSNDALVDQFSGLPGGELNLCEGLPLSSSDHDGLTRSIQTMQVIEASPAHSRDKRPKSIWTPFPAEPSGFAGGAKSNA
jgi:hypothetical protein